MHKIVQSFAIVERILRDRLAYFGEISRNEELEQKISDLITVTIPSLAIFGFVAGLSGDNITQALISTVKLPFLFGASGVICLPTLYYFSLLFGSRLRFLQTITLLLSAQSVSAVLALGFAPISLLFWLSGPEPEFMLLLNLLMLALAASLGLIFLVQGALYAQNAQPPTEMTLGKWIELYIRGALRSLVLTCWLGLYGLVGAQLSWTLRPLFGVSLEGRNFWSGMAHAILRLLN